MEYIYIDIYYILILSDILDGICADILSGSNWHTFLAYILAFFLAFYLASFQAFFLAFYLASILRFYLAFYWHLFRHSFWHSVWHPSWHSICILSFYLAWVRVLAHSTASWAGVLEGWGKEWRKETRRQGGKEARRQGGKEWVAPLSKTRYPHVAGGEKETLSFNLKQNQKTQVQNT